MIIFELEKGVSNGGMYVCTIHNCLCQW